ncbi:hypothetical protein ACFBZI_07575 [Moraxella sp. ZJ142]|uniref:hypothetical protein n=1 Tax=Moraxella marmotae TaxID=3344520 RepID=UPI0035D4AA8A
MSLTPNQEKFAQLVAAGVDELDAIKQVGYKASSASKQAYRMAKHAGVQNRIAELKAYRLMQDHTYQSKQQQNDPLRPDQTDAVVSKHRALLFLNEVYSNPRYKMSERLKAAIAALPYEEAKIAAVGKKETAESAAVSATTGGKYSSLQHQADFFSDVVS